MSQRDRMALLVVGVAAILAVAWFALVSPERRQADTAAQVLAAARAHRASAVAQEHAAQQAQTSLSSNVQMISLLSKAVPGDQGVATLVKQLAGNAGQAGVDFTAIKTGAPANSAGGPPGGATATPPATPTGARPSPPSPASAAKPGAAAGATGPVAAAAGISSYPTQSFSMIFSGDYLHLARFLDTVNQMTTVQGRDVRVTGRLLSIQSVSLGTGQAGRGMQATVNATAYTLPTTEPSSASLLANLPGPPAPGAPAGAAAPPTPSPGTRTQTQGLGAQVPATSTARVAP